MLGKKNTIVSGGSWLYAAYDGTKGCNDYNLSIVTSCNISKKERAEHDGNVFYLLPGGGMYSFDYRLKENINNCKWVLEQSKPDLIVLWGTESKLAYLFSLLSTTPILVYIQGLVGTIVRHYNDGIPNGIANTTVREIYDSIAPNSRINSYKKQAVLEADILKRAKGVVVENDWCEDQCLCANHSLQVYRNNLPIREAAFKAKWDINSIEKYTIFTNAGSYPIKGHHILFQAVAQVKRVFPDVKVYIPGPKYLDDSNHPFRQTRYSKFINQIIREHKLSENIEFTGFLSEEDLINRIEKSNVYVMPSIVENHSASLIEALIVGAPCVSSLVGGVGTLIHNKVNGLIYNSLDVESLAGNIMRVFEDDKLAKTLSEGTRTTREQRMGDFGKEMNSIYKRIAVEV